MTPSDYLDYLQRISVNEPNLSPYSKPKRVPELSDCSKLAQLIAVAADGNFHAFANTKLLEGARKAILHGAASDLRRFFRRIAIGELSTNDFNASAWRVPSGSGYVILIDHGLLRLFFAAAAVLSEWISTPKDNKPGRKIAERNLTLELALHIRCYLERQYLRDQALTFPMRGLQQAIACSLVASAIIFVLGHEIGHCLLGHLDDSRLIPRMVGNHQAHIYEKSREQEFEADRAGCVIALNWYIAQSDKFSLSMGLVGLDLVFGVFSLLEGLGSNESSHPPAMDRHSHFHDTVSGLPESPKVFVAQVWDLVSAVRPLLSKSAITIWLELIQALKSDA